MSPRSLSDVELVAACLNGETGAWDTLIDRYERLIYRTVLRMGLSHADADDAFQNVCVLLLRHLYEVRNVNCLSGWLLSTAKREAWRLHRSRRPVLLSEMPDREWEIDGSSRPGMDPPDTLDEALIRIEEQHLVRQALEGLPERCRLLLRLLYSDQSERSYAEVACRLNIPVGSIGPSRARCLQRLRKLLDEVGF